MSVSPRRVGRHSVKVRDGLVTVDRTLVEVDVPTRPAEVDALVARLGVPAGQVGVLTDLVASADMVLTGPDGPVRKLYLHAEHGLPTDRWPGSDAVLRYVGLKWDPASGAQRVALYRAADRHDCEALVEAVAGDEPGARDRRAAAATLLDTVAARPQAKGGPPLIVTGPGTDRRSIDVPVVGADWTLGEAIDVLAPWVEVAGLTAGAVIAAVGDSVGDPAARVALGRDHDDRPFVTVFHLGAGVSA